MYFFGHCLNFDFLCFYVENMNKYLPKFIIQNMTKKIDFFVIIVYNDCEECYFE